LTETWWAGEKISDLHHALRGAARGRFKREPNRKREGYYKNRSI
jgi:hypothetical protein